MKIKENILENTSLLPVTIIGNIQIAVIGIEGFVIQDKDKSLDDSQCIPLETAYLLAKGALKIMERENRNPEDEHCYDTSDSFSEYFNRVIIHGNSMKFTYWEKNRTPEWDDYIVIEDLEIAKRICEAIITIYDELDKDFFV